MNCPNCNEAENIELDEQIYTCYECPAEWELLADGTPFIINADWYCDSAIGEEPECDCGCAEGYGIPWSDQSFYAQYMMQNTFGKWERKIK